MALTDERLEAVRLYFQEQALTRPQLEDDLVDHCCSGIEELMVTSGYEFETAFAVMKQRLVPNGANEIEQDLEYLENYKPQTTMKKFVFMAGYASTLCLLAGIVLIAMSLFQKQNLELDREQTGMEMRVYASGYGQDKEITLETRRQMNIDQANHDLEAITSVRDLFLLGQQLLLVAVVLFAVTLLPYQFYRRYQRSVGEYVGT